jgi:hypothetical protein
MGHAIRNGDAQAELTPESFKIPPLSSIANSVWKYAGNGSTRRDFYQHFSEFLRNNTNFYCLIITNLDEIKRRNPVAPSYIPQMWEARHMKDHHRGRNTFDAVLYMFLRGAYKGESNKSPSD